MRTYQTLRVLGFLCMGLIGTTAIAQKKQTTDISAAMPTQIFVKDLEKLNFQYTIEIDKKEYSGYSQLTINPKYFDYVKTEQGNFKMGTLNFDKKIILQEKNGGKSSLISLDQWAKENASFNGHLIFMVDAVVLNVKPELVILDQNYMIDYSITSLDQTGLESPTVVVQLRMKTKENFKKGALDKKQKSE